MINDFVGEPGGLAVEAQPAEGDTHSRIYAARSRNAWHLTETEALVAADVALGRAPRAIAQDRGVSLHTVRTQLKRVLAKSGCHRQVELAVRIREL
jgi:DNA-binding CsgD family transcriptional regulator